MTTGQPKARFQCFASPQGERACEFTVACVVLHNMATIRGEQHPALQREHPDEDPIHPADIEDGSSLRGIICSSHFTHESTPPLPPQQQPTPRALQ